QQRIRNVIDIEAFQPKKALISAHVQEVEIRSRTGIYPTSASRPPPAWAQRFERCPVKTTGAILRGIHT
ncbi:MAG TPA: hypothetical protein VFA46_11460, partial [Actinomycetes bacterium]|nr:hypothetical protein [Actinomycetes bacterium]